MNHVLKKCWKSTWLQKLMTRRVKLRVGDILSGLLFLNILSYTDTNIYFLFGKYPCRIITGTENNFIIERLDTKEKNRQSVPKRTVFRAAFYSKKRKKLYEVHILSFKTSLLLVEKKTKKEEDYEKEKKDSCKSCAACKKSCTSSKSMDNYVFLTELL